MAKCVKIFIEDDVDLNQLFVESKHLADSSSDKFTLVVWDTEKPSNSHRYQKIKTCGRSVGKVNGKMLICGEGDYVCPECKY